MSAEPLIVCRGLGRVFRVPRRRPGFAGILRQFVRPEVDEFVALADIDLEIEAGSFVGLIGVNGAGKTTLVKCLTGIIPASTGSATLFGRDCFHLTDGDKRRIALVMGQRSQLWWDLPARDSFELLREIYGVSREDLERRVREFAERLDVADRLDVQLRQLSLGQRMKMEIIGALLHRPEVVFLDEPTIGLDLLSQDTIRQFLLEVNREEGATVILTSHDMEDIESTCRRILLLDDGRAVFDGGLLELQQRTLGVRSIVLHLEAHSRGWSEDLAAELAPFGAQLDRAAERTLGFLVPPERTQSFVRRLFELFEVRDLAIERQPLENLVRGLFRSGAASRGARDGGEA